MQRSQTVPPRAKRKVTFPPPLALGLEERKKAEERERVLSTPYPVDGGGGRRGNVLVYLRLRGRGGEVGVGVGSVVVPEGRRKGKGGDEGMAGEEGKAAFDDRELFLLLRKEYTRRRGWGRVLMGARRVREVRLRVGSSAVDGMDGGCDDEPFDGHGGITSLHSTWLFRSPNSGKGAFDCVDFITNTSTHDTVTFELVEDWSVARIALATGAVVAASLVATLLWVFLGTGGGGLGGGLDGAGMGFRGVGERVEAGVVLGVLVLLVGWTGVGAWVGLSWVG